MNAIKILGLALIPNFLLTVTAKGQAAKTASQNHILFLNASNFDFKDELSGNYLGHININAPNLDGTKWGINTGIMKLNYFTDDSTERTAFENVQIDPLKKLQPGDQYLFQQNQYKTKIKRTNWSFYIQPLYHLISTPNNKLNIYVHAHFELLVNTVEQKTSITHIDQDTLTFNNDSNFVARKGISDASEYKRTKPNGYFGLGTTFDISPWDDGYLFIQATVGMTSDNPVQFLINGNAPLYKTKSWNGFYLIRAYYSQRLSDAALIVIGTDIRGLLPKYDPLYAAYVGLNLNINQLVH